MKFPKTAGAERTVVVPQTADAALLDQELRSLADVETIARHALAEVRQTIRGYRAETLHAEFERVRQEAVNPDYRRALETIASLRPKVDLFFDKVLVNAPDPNVRQNRLALLHAILTESSTIADFSEIVTNT